MDDNANKSKSVWNDVARIWGRITGVIAAIGILATFITKVLKTPPELTYSLFAALGVVLLIISFYVDRQSEYTHQEILKYEGKAREDFTKAMQNQKQMQSEYKKDTDKRIEIFADNVEQLIHTTQETRKDTLRIQLLMMMMHQPKNTDSVLKLAEKYFVELHGNWYMTTEFTRWANENNVMIPQSIYQAMTNNHNNDNN